MLSAFFPFSFSLRALLVFFIRAGKQIVFPFVAIAVYVF